MLEVLFITQNIVAPFLLTPPVCVYLVGEGVHALQFITIILDFLGLACDVMLMYLLPIIFNNTFSSFSGIASYQIQESLSPSLPVLGSNGFVLRCDISIPDETLQGISLQRKRSTDSNFVEIVSFPSPYFPRNYTLLDNSLSTRTSITQPSTASTTSASLTFENTECSDIAEYKWSVTLYNGTVQPPVDRLSDVKVQGKIFKHHHRIFGYMWLNFICMLL